MPAKPFKRAGLHRLECPCGGYVYATVAQLETRGMPVCPCGSAYEPERIELALLLELRTPVVDEYYRRVAVKIDAQRPAAIRRGRNGRSTADLDSMELRAYDEIRAEQRQCARERRLAALRPVPEAMPF